MQLLLAGQDQRLFGPVLVGFVQIFGALVDFLKLTLSPRHLRFSI